MIAWFAGTLLRLLRLLGAALSTPPSAMVNQTQYEIRRGKEETKPFPIMEVYNTKSANHVKQIADKYHLYILLQIP